MRGEGWALCGRGLPTAAANRATSPGRGSATLVRFVFEHEPTEGTWERLGVADATGEDAIGEALDRLAEEYGGSLPAGRYRYRPESHDSGWAHLFLKPDGRHELVDFP